MRRVQSLLDLDRFWVKVSDGQIIEGKPELGPCYLWTAAINTSGYGRFKVKQNGVWKSVEAHRWLWIAVRGPIEGELKTDYLCHTLDLSCPGGVSCLHRSCVNVLHMELVTNDENVRRGRAGERNRSKTHCPYGHLYDGENTVGNKYGKRVCRTCTNERNRAYYHLHREDWAARKLDRGTKNGYASNTFTVEDLASGLPL